MSLHEHIILIPNQPVSPFSYMLRA